MKNTKNKPQQQIYEHFPSTNPPPPYSIHIVHAVTPSSVTSRRSESEKPSGEDNGVGPAGSGGGEAGKARQRAVMSFSLTPSRGGEVRSETFDY